MNGVKTAALSTSQFSRLKENYTGRTKSTKSTTRQPSVSFQTS
jgi:hypothetical protein